MTILLPIVGLYGLIFGSFLNAVIYRVPRGESLNTRSHCTRCDRQITAKDNIPLLSYAVLRGKCRGCGLPIPLRYPAVELAGAVSWIGVAWHFGPPLTDELGLGPGLVALVGLLWLATASIALALIDLEHQLLPNRIVYPTLFATASTLSVAALWGSQPDRILHAFLGLLAMGAFYGIIWFWKPGAMGFGDVRLSWVLGFVLAWFSWSALVVGAFAAFAVGSVVGIALVIRRNAGGKTAVAFGPWMLVGAWIGLVAGPDLIDMYLSIGGMK